VPLHPSGFADQRHRRERRGERERLCSASTTLWAAGGKWSSTTATRSTARVRRPSTS